MTNYEKIRQMSVEEMAKFFFDIVWDNCVCCNGTRNKECKSCKLGYQKWLESEAEE